jgi:NAD(P)-dependent dehydrogenase (short-subunit alcohol dehydrogenase family)
MVFLRGLIRFRGGSIIGTNGLIILVLGLKWNQIAYWNHSGRRHGRFCRVDSAGSILQGRFCRVDSEALILEGEMMRSVLITGGNAGLGKETARLMALGGTERIYLACRNPEKAAAAKADLERSTSKSVFSVLILDVMDLDSVRDAVAALPEPVEAAILNAGGVGGGTPGALTRDGVTHVTAVNILGHAVLVEALIQAGKLTRAAVYSGSEACRGIPMLRMARPALKTSSVEEFVSVADGSFFGGRFDNVVAMTLSKYMAALWMSSAARRHPELRLITMSPGGSAGSTMSDAPALMRFVGTNLVQPLMKAFGRYHDLETGARRYLAALSDPSLQSGVFYGSPYPGLTGSVVDQSTIFADIGDEAIQDNAYEAISGFVSASAVRRSA